ncbi:hypothetical protein PT285_01195 [Lactobacillus sp. ESL0791]|uniref:hypothetical protein n=1 Tax=Lactobacillus sp. ESL0791 TaxID=2983234 RepID=UPI0023F6F96F|nr:hypothetical protein [Lactobacillus sp. ESL0791]MDF7638055.1 hypothetical protein [Lactobacillus sp. ESL0791]
MITKAEKKFIDALLQKKQLIFGIIITLLFVIIRLTLFNFKSGDYIFYLKPWYKAISGLGGLGALRTQIGDYSVPYQFVIALFTYLHVNDLYLYKLLSVVFDFVLAFFAAKLVTSVNNKINFLVPYSLVLLLPTVILNSAMWAQADSIYAGFLMIALWLLFISRYGLSFAFLGVAIAFKLQAVLLVPFYLLVYLIRKDFSIFNFLISLLSLYLCNLPGFIFGRSILTPFKVYQTQTVEFKGLFFNLFNFSTFFYNSKYALGLDNYGMLRNFMILLTFIILLCGYLIILTKMNTGDMYGEKFVVLAAWTFWTCTMFLPSMHERYGYFADLLLVLLAINNRKVRPLAVISVLASLAGYTKFLLGINYDSGLMFVIAALELASYLCFTELVLSKKDHVKLN